MGFTSNYSHYLSFLVSFKGISLDDFQSQKILNINFTLERNADKFHLELQLI